MLWEFSNTYPVLVLSSNVVQFRDRSVGVPLTWLWNFGDSNTSTERNPKHTYSQTASPQEFEVSLHVTDLSGMQSTATKTIQIPPSTSPKLTIFTQDGLTEIAGLGPLDFGVLEDPPVEITLRLVNTGASALGLVSVGVTGDFFSLVSGPAETSLEPAEFTFITLRYGASAPSD